MGIQIISPGALTTIQDYGRIGYGEIGISPSGAVDICAMEVANILVGNKMGEGVLECTLFGPTILFARDNVIAITGANMNPKVNAREIPMNRATCVKAGDSLVLSFAAIGCRSYIAFAGGLQIDDYLGSKSTNMKCALGGFHGRALKARDEIVFREPAEILPRMDKRIYELPEEDSKPRMLRVVMGPQEDYFTIEGINTFETGIYKLSNDSNRMACKLTGPVITGKQATDIISDGIALGSIQVSSNGQPIIMLSDRQTTGGYAKIASVISTDISSLSQCKPGDEVRFQIITLKDAQRIYKTHSRFMKKFQKAMKQLH
jgi:biotin-dependent carboxylase-like uncharacterized protein